MNAAWYTGVLRRIAWAITRIADRLDEPPCRAEPLAPKKELLTPEEHVFELRNRLWRYY